MVECLEGEIWVDIKGFPYFQVSNKGRVRSLQRTITEHTGVKHILKDRLRKQTINDKGYATVNLVVDGKHNMKLCHRLVAEAFIPNLCGKPQVNHIDGNKLNNVVENLEWVTNDENINHAKENSLTQQANKKRVCQIDAKTGDLIAEYESINDACRINGFPNTAKPSICRCCNHIKNYRTSQGYRWMYSTEFFGLKSRKCTFCSNAVRFNENTKLLGIKVNYCPMCGAKR